MDNKLEVTLTKQQRQIARAADTGKGNRPILQTVKLGGGRIIAANGFILAECPVKSEGDASILLDAASILKAKDARGFNGVPVIYNGNGEAKLITRDDTILLAPVDGTYPNTDALYPKEKEVFHIAISPSILKQLAGIVGDEKFIKLRFYGTTSPVTFEAGETKGCLMPMSAQWD